MLNYCSFDVFDTLLSYKLGGPKDLLLIVGDRANKKLDIDIPPPLFAGIRIKAERELYMNNIEPTLDIIYKNIESELEIDENISTQLRDLEISIELEHATPVWKNIELLWEKRSGGNQILYISDMYLSEVIIKNMLEKYDIILPGENLYVSCEYGKSKKSGLLFTHIMEKEGISANQLTHFGNSPKSDIDGAELAGVKGVLLPICNHNRYEHLILTFKNRYPLNSKERLFYSGLAGISRQCRLKSHEVPHEICKVGASVAAPLLYFFVKYLLEEAKKDKVDTLYFLSRDGYILYQIAQELIDNDCTDLKLKYLYISRQVLVNSELTELLDEKTVNDLINVYRFDTLRDMLIDLGLPEQELKNKGLHHLAGKNILDYRISHVNPADILHFANSKELHPYIKKRAAERKKKLLKYLNQEGLFTENRKIGIVDIGWNLTIQDKLSQLIKIKNRSLFTGYYFGINHANTKESHGVKKAFMWDHRYGADWIDIQKFIKIMEVFCTAPYGQLIDFMDSNGRIKPVLLENESEELVKWGIHDLHKVLNNFFDQTQNKKFLEKEVDNWDRILCKELLEKICLEPESDEIEVWGSFPYYISKDGSNISKLYDYTSKSDFLKRSFRTGQKPDLINKEWSSLSKPDSLFEFSIKLAVIPRKIYNKIVKLRSG